MRTHSLCQLLHRTIVGAPFSNAPGLAAQVCFHLEEVLVRRPVVVDPDRHVVRLRIQT